MATNPSYEAPPAAKRRKRKSRWETAEPSPTAPTGSGTVANMQLALPPGIAKLISANSGGSPQDALAQLQLNRRLEEVNARIASNDFADRRPMAERSPSPPPKYDASGVRTNTREERVKQSLVRERQDIIGKLMQTGSGFKPPSDYKQTKLMKKLYVPTREYPGYNFIGLIIGPRGNTQKRMERETGAKIALRGKGSVKEGRTNQNALQGRVDPTENEDLHVVVTCDNEDGLNRAVEMVEQLLVPVDESANQHKRLQLRELAELNGTLRSEEFWQRRREEQDATDIYKLPEHMKAKVDEQYQKDVAKFTGEDPSKMNQEYQNFLDEIGGRTTERPGSNSNPNPVPSHLAGGRAGGSGGGRGAGYQGRQRGDREIDESNLYVGYLPRDLREPDLHSLFETYGHVSTPQQPQLFFSFTSFLHPIKPPLTSDACCAHPQRSWKRGSSQTETRESPGVLDLSSSPQRMRPKPPSRTWTAFLSWTAGFALEWLGRRASPGERIQGMRPHPSTPVGAHRQGRGSRSSTTTSLPLTGPCSNLRRLHRPVAMVARLPHHHQGRQGRWRQVLISITRSRWACLPKGWACGSRGGTWCPLHHHLSRPLHHHHHHQRRRSQRHHRHRHRLRTLRKMSTPPS